MNQVDLLVNFRHHKMVPFLHILTSTNFVKAFPFADITFDAGIHDKRLSFSTTTFTPSARFHYSVEHVIACSATDITSPFCTCDYFS
jgi:hypothetical protein